MKRIVNTFTAGLIITFLFNTQGLLAQNKKYEKTMIGFIQEIDGLQQATDMKNQAAKFERVAQAETQEWLPPYYASLLYTMAAFKTEDGDERDDILDVAQEWIDKATKLENKDADIHALQGYIYIGRITVSPMVRGMTYSGDVSSQVAIAKKIDPENPRPYLVHGMLLQGMPAFVGGGMEKACPQFATANEKMASFNTASNLHPNWGEGTLTYFTEKCQEQ